MSRTNSIVRKRRAAEKVYLPSNARDNQYIIAEMLLTDELITLIVGDVDQSVDKPYQLFYQNLAKLVFDIVEESGIEHANFIANSRLVRVRNSDEQQVLHTAQQSFFFYNPTQNSTFKAYFDGGHRSNKVKFLFLANGDNLRGDSAAFHHKVFNAVTKISQQIGLAPGVLKMRDHQHITYDIFGADKGHKETVTHAFREISARYLQQGYKLSGAFSAITYAVVSVPMTRRLLKNVDIDYDCSEPFNTLYEKIKTAFTNAAAQHGLNHGAMIANGMSPIVRYDETQTSIVNGEIISLGFNPANAIGGIICKWQSDKLVDTIRLVFFASDVDESHNTYGKFVNQVTQCIGDMAKNLNWKKESDYMLMRLHQQVIRRV
ncbi:MAG: DUF3083 family protein [Psychrobium sp.]|nr:DUF3083 family protein [Psychrobium sp.]